MRYSSLVLLLSLSACATAMPASTTLPPTPSSMASSSLLPSTLPPATQAPSTMSHGGPARDLVSFIDSMRARGHVVIPGEPITQPFFSVPGFTPKIDGQVVQVYEYADAATAAREAAKISPTGSSIGTSMASWVGPPHFYLKERVLVLYVGSSAPLMTSLNAVLGAQIAGAK